MMVDDQQSEDHPSNIECSGAAWRR